MTAHADLTTTIEPKSDQTNADDLIAGPRTIRVTDVRLLGGDQPVAIGYEGDNGKPYKPCKSMRRVLVHVWGGDGSKYVGRSMTLYCDPTVKFGGADVGGIRISHMSEIDKPVTMALTETRARRKPFTVQPLKPRAPEPVPDIDAEAAFKGAMDAAKRGRAGFEEWWRDNKPLRAAVKPRFPEIEAAVKRASETVTVVTEDGSVEVPANQADDVINGGGE